MKNLKNGLVQGQGRQNTTKKLTVILASNTMNPGNGGRILHQESGEIVEDEIGENNGDFL